jgi:pimeloyl-ACP methyl ester carboxylesterase
VVDRGAGTPLLLLHGIPTCSFLWRDVLPVVATAHRCLVPDLLGFGYSEKPRAAHFGVGAQADLIEELLDVVGVGEVGLAAHDFGALVAAELLARRPERITALVLTNTSLRLSGWRAGAPLSLLRLPVIGELAMWQARRWMLRLAMRIYVSNDARLTPEVMAHYWWPFAHGFKRVLLALSRERWADEALFLRWREALRGYSGPVLVAWGLQDPTFGQEVADILQLLPAARYEPLASANHFVQEDAPDALGQLIVDFLAQRPK